MNYLSSYVNDNLLSEFVDFSVCFVGVFWPLGRISYGAPAYNMSINGLCNLFDCSVSSFRWWHSSSPALGCTLLKVILSQTWCFWTYNILQVRQCMYNVTVMYVKTNIVAAKRNTCYIFWMCVCSLMYPIWHALFVICSLSNCIFYFPNYLIKGMTFEKQIFEYKMYFDFFYKFRLKHFSF